MLDPRTLVVVATAVALVPGVISVLAWFGRTYPGRWVLGNLMVALALLLLALRGRVPDWSSIVLANALVIGAAIAFLQGIRQFRGLPIRWWPECLVGASALVAVVCFRYVVDNINIRIFAMSLATGSYGVACGFTLFKEMPQGKLGPAITGLVFALAGVINLWRGIYVVASAPATGLFDPTAPNAVFFLGASLGAIGWSFGFMLLTAERLQVDSGARNGDLSHAFLGTACVGRLEPAVPDGEVRQELRRVVESDVFRRSTQMERFLTVAVERVLLGHPEELKEYALGRDVFNRGDGFDPRSDPIVRVEAQRLRRKLREYYESQGLSDPVLIKLLPGRYVPSFEYRNTWPTLKRRR